MNKILDLISPRTKKKEVDDNDSYSDDDFEDGDEESPVKTSRTENTEADSILTTSVTPKTKEAGDDDLNDFLNGLSSSSSDEDDGEGDKDNEKTTVKIIEKEDQKKKAEDISRKSQEKLSSSMPDIKNNSIPQMRKKKLINDKVTKKSVPNVVKAKMSNSSEYSSKLLSTKDKEESVMWRRLHDALKNTASPPVSALREIQDRFTESDPDDLGYVSSRCFLNVRRNTLWNINHIIGKSLRSNSNTDMKCSHKHTRYSNLGHKI